jgi:hypothetical protein
MPLCHGQTGALQSMRAHDPPAGFGFALMQVQ